MKKFLSLVLALVMVLSLGVTAGAVDFTDEAAITKEEAVGVLAGLGIINGYEAADGTYSFAPNGNITRGAAAKIICMIKLGTKVAGILSCETAPFKDVAKDSTFAPYIAYCAAEGIVGGYTDGTYKPGNPVTGYAFTKMLLNALGIEGNYEGANYGVNVALAAEKAKLFEGMDADTSYAANCTREDACQLAFNALNYSATGKTTKYEVKDGEDTLYSGTDALTALVMKQSSDTATLKLVESAEGSLGAKNFGLTKGTKTDDFGRKSTTYTNGKDGDDKVTYASFGSDAVKTYTTAVKLSKIWADLGFSKTTDKVTMKVKVDGGDFTTYTVSKHADDATHYGTTIGGQGTLVEVYKTGTKAYEIIVVNTYVHKLVGKNTDIFAATAAGTNTDAKDAYIKIGDLEYKTSAFAKDDVVLYTKTATKIVNVVKAASISGKVTAVEGGDTKTYFRVDGVQYKLAANNLEAGKTTKSVIGTTGGYKYVDPAVEYTYYLDTYGNVIYAVEGKQDEIKAQYIYVTQYAVKAADTKAVAGSDLFSGTENTTAPVVQAKVVDLATGAISVKNVAVVKNTEDVYCFATKTGAAGDPVPTADELKDSNGNSTNGKPAVWNKIYEYYTLADGSIVLEKEFQNAVQIKAKKNTASVASGVYANAATKLSVVTLTFEKNNTSKPVTAATVSTVTGIANFPATETTYTRTLVTKNDKGMASELVAVEYKQAEKSAVNYAIYKAPGEVGADTKHAFYKDGAVVEYTLATTFTGTLVEKHVFALTFTSGKLSAAEDLDSAKKTGTVAIVEDTYMVIGTEVVYFAEGCEVYDADASYAADVIAADDVITYFVNDDGKAEFIIIDNA